MKSDLQFSISQVHLNLFKVKKAFLYTKVYNIKTKFGLCSILGLYKDGSRGGRMLKAEQRNHLSPAQD